MNRQLIEKYFQNQCSPDEVRKLVNWINSHASKAEFGNDFQLLWQQTSNKENDYAWKDAWKKLQERIEVEELINSLPFDKGQQNKTNQKPAYQLAVAAVISLVVISIASLFYFNNKTLQQQPSTVHSMVQKSTEKGQKLTIHLEDGSKVMLNSQSTLKFPGHFTDSLREVWLQGEAYFNVVGDAKKPFVVHSGNINTTVLGTSFNINAYQDQNIFEVAITSGKVEVTEFKTGDNLVINPGEMAVYNNETTLLTNQEFSEISIAWKDGIIYFKNADFDEIISTLERWYGVDFLLQGNVDKQWEFSGKFQNESLRNILEALQFAYDFKYKLDRKKVYVNF